MEAGKGEWRRWARSVRMGLDFPSLSAAVSGHLASWDGLAGGVLVYLAMSDEVDLSGLIAARTDIRWATTRTPEQGGLTLHPLDGPMERHRLGFEQPAADAPAINASDINAVLVPGLAFDRRGVRLGRGAAYYDRLLPRMRPDCRLVGVAPSDVVVDALPFARHDVAMTALATEDGVEPVGGGVVPVPLPPASQRVVAAAAALGLDIDVHEFPEGTKTSADAARAVGCEVSAIAKSLVFMVDDRPVVVLMPGDLRLDPAKLARAAGGAAARRASLDEARTATGFGAGGTPAFGHATPIRVFADPQLQRHDEVWSAAGTPTTVYPVALADLIAASGAEWADLAAG